MGGGDAELTLLLRSVTLHDYLKNLLGNGGGVGVFYCLLLLLMAMELMSAAPCCSSCPHPACVTKELFGAAVAGTACLTAPAVAADAADYGR